MKVSPHRPRPIRFLELATIGDWRIKVYGISQDRPIPERACMERAPAIARSVLPEPAVTEDRYGVGFVVVHQARLFNQILVDWWERENELRHHVFKAEPPKPHDFKNITATGEAFCLWELRVLGFEREAWMQTMLKTSPGPSLDAYLDRRLHEDS